MNPGIHDIKPRQLHALVLLLVLLPVVPVLLLVHSLQQNQRLARETALAQLSNLYGPYLKQLGASGARALARDQNEGVDPRPERIRVQEHLQAALGSAVTVRVLPKSSAGDGAELDPGSVLISSTTLDPPLEGWQVRLAISGEEFARLTTDPGETAELFPHRLLVALVLAIAATTGWTVTRQIRLNELRNSAIAAVAHELKTPVASSRLLLETLEAHRHRNPDLVGEYLGLLGGENRRIGGIIEDFLTLARMEQRQYPFHFSATPLGEVIADAIDHLGIQLAPPRCRFDAQLPERLPILRADRDALRMVFSNLLENAVKYSGPSPDITLEARRMSGHVLIQIADRGIGIPPDEMHEIFRPFRQADNRLSRTREGCGLGLSIVRHIVRAHGGRVWAENRPGGGSLFCVSIPVPRGSKLEPVERPQIPGATPAA